MSRSKVKYEWSIRPVDNTHGDVHDNHFQDKLSEYRDEEDLRNAITQRRDKSDMHLELALVRLWGNDLDGVIDREVATVIQAFDVIDGEAIPIDNKWQLPICFDEGSKVPQRFHNELGSAVKRLIPDAKPTFRNLESMF
tara:strand:- start:1 stop:417 length:417 start_codon:yes stop_codon:yes gene_type:complete